MVLRPKTRESGSPPGPTGAPEMGGKRHGTGQHDAARTRRTDAPREPHRRPGPHSSGAPVSASERGRDAGWSSPVARQAHNLKVAGSNPAPATRPSRDSSDQPVARACSASARYLRSFSANDSRTSPLGD